MIARFFLMLAASIIAFASVSRADHLPYDLQAKGRPESRIAGIDMKRARLTDIIRLYGRPSRVEGVDHHNPRIADSFNYYWVKPGLNLHVLIQRLPNLEYVSLIEVETGTSRKNGRTGAGLKLGDTLQDLKRVYGNRFKMWNNPKLKVHAVTLQWRREEFSLEAALDEHNRITAFTLAAPE